ncbi:MAG: VWA domain-containing protein [Candidatus Sericytochromatia bacterium]
MKDEERLRRWRLLLGGGEADGTGCRLGGDDAAIDTALGTLYGKGEGSEAKRRQGNLAASAPRVARWLGDIRQYFPARVVRILQQDAIERLNLRTLLLEPELLSQVEPDVNLVADLIELSSVMPDRTKALAREVVQKVLDELEKRLAAPLRQAVTGSLLRSVRRRRPRPNEINWDATIKANLRHYQPSLGTLIPETLIGHGRKQSSLQDIVLCIDQSGSMASSVVYASLFGAVLASIRAVNTRLVAFDTAVADLSDKLSDPVDVLFGIQLGGGTDIAQALQYCQSQISRPAETTLILISDLYEGGNAEQLLQRARELVAAGVQLIGLLALSDDGAPAYDAQMAQKFAALGCPVFACTPELFPELMAAALERQDLGLWAARQGIVTARS